MIAEDNRADIFLIREALAGINAELCILTDGEQVIEFLAQVERDPKTPCPNLILLDINLPKRRGAEVLQVVRAGVRCGKTRVLVVTSSDSSSDRAMMDRLGSNGYFRKPSDYKEFMKLGVIARLLLDEAAAIAS